MKYSVEPRDQIFVKGHKFLSLAKNVCKNIAKNISKNLISKYSADHVQLNLLEKYLIVLKNQV